MQIDIVEKSESSTKDRLVYEAYLGDQNVGYVDFALFDDHTANGTNGHIHEIEVDPMFRRQGIGTTLMKYAEDELAKKYFSSVTLGVDIENPDAARLYERLGYQVVGRYARDKDGRLIEGERTILMKKMLTP